MKKYQQDLIRLIIDSSVDPDAQTLATLSELSARDMASFFVDVSFLVTCVVFVQEQHWIESRGMDEDDQKIVFSNFVKKYFKAELAPLLFFHATLQNASVDNLKNFSKTALIVQEAIVKFAKLRPVNEKNEFATCALKAMSELFEFEYQLFLDKEKRNSHLEYSLYRTFDVLDDFFELDYEKDVQSPSDQKSSERLYLGSNLAVQSSYTTILLALRYLRIPSGTKFIDLGSGFGRVGLVIGLLRPDIQFIGYEYVEQRVKIAAAAAEKLGMSQHVHFITQNLAAEEFQIPNAETYYLYDPFSDETYKYVVSQLNVIGGKNKINVITKGNAKNYFNANSQRNIWSKPQEFDSGNFCLFRSH